MRSTALRVDAVGDDHSHRVADMAYLALRQQGMWRFFHRLTDPSGDAPGAWHAVGRVGSDILAGEDRYDARARQRLGLVDREDFRVGMGRAQEHGIKLMR